MVQKNISLKLEQQINKKNRFIAAPTITFSGEYLVDLDIFLESGRTHGAECEQFH